MQSETSSSRSVYFVQLFAVVLLSALLLSTMPADRAVGAVTLPKLFLLARMAVLVLVCSWFLWRGGERWRDVGLRRPTRWWMLPTAVVGGFVLLIIASTLLFRIVLPSIGAAAPQFHRTPSWHADRLEYLFWAFPVAWGSAAFGEELLARGFILDRIAKVVGSSSIPATISAVVLQAAIFGAFHAYQGAGGILVTGVAGLILGITWLGGGRNLWASIVLHGLVDFLNANGM